MLWLSYTFYCLVSLSAIDCSHSLSQCTLIEFELSHCKLQMWKKTYNEYRTTNTEWPKQRKRCWYNWIITDQRCTHYVVYWLLKHNRKRNRFVSYDVIIGWSVGRFFFVSCEIAFIHKENRNLDRNRRHTRRKKTWTQIYFRRTEKISNKQISDHLGDTQMCKWMYWFHCLDAECSKKFKRKTQFCSIELLTSVKVFRFYIIYAFNQNIIHYTYTEMFCSMFNAQCHCLKRLKMFFDAKFFFVIL